MELKTFETVSFAALKPFVIVSLMPFTTPVTVSLMPLKMPEIKLPIKPKKRNKFIDEKDKEKIAKYYKEIEEFNETNRKIILEKKNKCKYTLFKSLFLIISNKANK